MEAFIVIYCIMALNALAIVCLSGLGRRGGSAMLLALVALLFSGTPGTAADFTFPDNGITGSGWETDNIKCAVVVRNDTAENIRVQIENLDGSRQATLGSGGCSGTLLPIPTGFTYDNPASFSYAWADPDGLIAPGASVYVFQTYRAYGISGSGSPADITQNATFTLPIYCKRTSAATWDRYTPNFTKSILWDNQYGNDTVQASPKDGSYINWGTFAYNGVGPSSGDINITAKTEGHMKFSVDGVVKFDGHVTAGQVIGWHSDSPAPFLGKYIDVEQDGVNYIHEQIANQWFGVDIETGLPDGRVVFTINVSVTADGQKPTPAGGDSTPPSPGTGPVKAIAPPNTGDGQYSGKSPGLTLAPDAKTNTATNDTVKEEYEAVRQGVEDALNGNAGIDSEVTGSDMANSTGTTLGNSFGSSITNLKNAAVISMPGSGGMSPSGDGLSLPFIAGLYVNVQVPAWAPVCYWLVTVLVTYQGLLCIVQLARKAFAN